MPCALVYSVGRHSMGQVGPAKHRRERRQIPADVLGVYKCVHLHNGVGRLDGARPQHDVSSENY